MRNKTDNTLILTHLQAFTTAGGLQVAIGTPSEMQAPLVTKWILEHTDEIIEHFIGLDKNLDIETLERYKQKHLQKKAQKRISDIHFQSEGKDFREMGFAYILEEATKSNWHCIKAENIGQAFAFASKAAQLCDTQGLGTEIDMIDSKSLSDAMTMLRDISKTNSEAVTKAFKDLDLILNPESEEPKKSE